jgi:hypothetical protein
MDTYRVWKERKREIEEIFRLTRVSKIILPIDLEDNKRVHKYISALSKEEQMVLKNLPFEQQIEKLFLRVLENEQTTLSNIRHPIEELLRCPLDRRFATQSDESEDHSNNKICNIAITHDPQMSGGQPYTIHKVREGLNVFYSSIDRYKRQISISAALAAIALYWDNQDTSSGSWTPEKENDEDCFYLMSSLLKLHADMDNGAVLRKEYVIPSDKVDDEIKKVYENYDSSAEVPRKNEIDLLIKWLKKKPVPALNCEKKPTAKYIIDNLRNNLDYQEPGFEGLKILIAPWDNPSKDLPKGIGRMHYQKMIYTINHMPKEVLEFILSRENELVADDAQNIIRLIVAHEIGHLTLHFKWRENYSHGNNGKIKSTPEEERDAFYYALLLLKHREMLYCAHHNCGEYTTAKNKWKKLITYVYSALIEQRAAGRRTIRSKERGEADRNRVGIKTSQDARRKSQENKKDAEIERTEKKYLQWILDD